MRKKRFKAADIKAWRKQGFAIIPDFFSRDEITLVREDYERIYGTQGEGAGRPLIVDESVDEQGEFRSLQFKNIDTLPYEGSVEMNLLSLHPQLIAYAKALLGVDQVHLYQSHTWAKFTGETDYDQALHCDFGNHTLVVPSDDPALRTVDFIIYLTDVTDAHGALHYVPKPQSDAILGPGRIGAHDPDSQSALRAVEVSAASPAGSLLAHGIDTFHRGTNLTEPEGYRYTMTVGYKAAGNDMIGYHVWQQTGERDWTQILAHASPEQLACLGIPEPGHPYWTTRTLKLTQARWPDWNMTAYFNAAKRQGSSEQ